MTYSAWFHHLGAAAEFDEDMVLCREVHRIAEEPVVDHTDDPAQADE